MAMSPELADIIKIVTSAIAGGLVTAAGAFPIYNAKLAKMAAEMVALKESCATCRTSVTTAVDSLATSVKSHHEDDDKHMNKSTVQLLTDILNRVTRIEGRLFDGTSRRRET